jgi:hypothetical protein
LDPYWVECTEPTLRQGDLLPDCLVPVPTADFDSKAEAGSTIEIPCDVYDLIVVTQSCDLANEPIPQFVVACPIHHIEEFELVNPKFKKKGRWNEVLKGRIAGLHLLASPTTPANNREALVVDFREIYSLPHDYLIRRVSELESHWRLRSPYLEHFSQAFARHFMRVGLPSDVPRF